MAGPHRILRALAATVVLGLAAAPAAHANAFETVYRDYKKDGSIDACAHSPGELQEAKAQVPNDIEQYAPDFPDALDAAAQQRASGSCANKGNHAAAGSTAPAAGATTTTPAGGAPAPAVTSPAPGSSAPAASTPAPTTTTPAPPASAQPAPPAQDNAINAAATTTKTSSGSGAPAAVILLAVVGALLLLGAIAYGAARWWAWEPRWWPAARHAGAEAGWRASAAWAEFTDWVRLGR